MKPSLRLHPIVALMLCSLALFCSPIIAQDYRATLIGLVTDSTDAAIVGAKVKVTNERTGVSVEVVTTTEGLYTVPYLNPDVYTVEVSASGFKLAKRTGVTLRVSDKQNLPFKLEAGDITATVTITGEQQLIQTETASRGQNFDELKTSELPLNGRQVYMLLSLTPGVHFTQENFGPTGFSGTRGWDVNDRFSVNGSQAGTTQFLLNGAPISVVGTFQVAPNVEAIQEFKVMTNVYDAQFGRSGGGTVNTTLKAGTNQWHGSVFNFHRNRVLDSNFFQNNALPVERPRGPRITNNYGGVIGFPLRKDKDFVFASFEGYREKISFAGLSSGTVPLDLRDGKNFTKYGVRIYDPLTTRLCRPGIDTPQGQACRSTYIRDQFPNNEIPTNRISPVAREILKLYPEPNTNLTALNNNFVAFDAISYYKYDQPMGRWDHIFNDRHKLHTIVTFNEGQEFRNQNGFPGVAMIGNINAQRRNQNYILDYTWVASPTSLWNFRLSFGRFTQFFPDGVAGDDFTFDKLGIKRLPAPPTISSKSAPRIQVANYSDVISNRYPWNSDNQWDFTASLRQTRGRHSLSFGGEYAYIARARTPSLFQNGILSFNANQTRQYRDLSQGATDGYSVASLLLGLPDSGRVDWGDTFYRTWPYIAGYVQDDWKLSSKLTINLGLRYDVQIPWIERFNRVNGAFDFTQKHPDSDRIIAKWKQIKADYDRTNPRFPYPDAPTAIYGSRPFLNGKGARLYDTDWSNIQPRLGVAWNFLPKIVLRGGFGIFHPTDAQEGSSDGFTRSTGFVNSRDGILPSGGLTGPYSLEDPFPDGLLPPSGASLGEFFLAGGAVTFDGRQRPLRRSYQYSLGFEFELPWSTVLELSYAGRYTNKIPTRFNFNGISLDDFERARVDNQYSNLNIPNPFYDIYPRNVTLGATTTVARGNLLRPFPGYGDLNQDTNPWGNLRYDALQVRAEKRAFGNRNAGTLTFTLAYSYSKNLQRINRLNNFNIREDAIKQLSDLDKTHIYSWAGVWDLPFGKGRRWFANRPAILGVLADGWNFNWIHSYASGYPVGKPDAVFSCANYRVDSPNENQWFNNTRTCYTARQPFTLRFTEDRFPDIRLPTAQQLTVAVSRRFQYRERYITQFKAEMFNALNTPIRFGPNTNFTAPDFGVVPKAQTNFPRNVQLSLRVTF